MKRVSGLLLLIFVLPVFALEPVSLQLRWKHQFQFAGYYAALEKGYYAQAGLDVTLHENGPTSQKNAIARVMNGEVQFGVSNAGLVAAFAEGKPVVALASILQHSAAVWIVTDPEIQSLHDLAGKRLMALMPISESVEFVAPFLREGIDVDSLRWRNTSFSIHSLLEGETDALNAYLSNEPFLMREMGVPFYTISPRTYGIDFYSDVLFTHRDYLREYPQRVERFRQASLEGWRYAMMHPEEIIQLIHEKYSPEKSLAHLRYEANVLRELIVPDLVEIGHMNAGRWENIARTFVDLGVIEPGFDLEGFIYTGKEGLASIQSVGIALLMALPALVLGGSLLHYYRLTRHLKIEIAQRRKAEARLKTLVNTDHLTGLCNRRNFYLQSAREHARFLRYRQSYALLVIDVDWFKQINDVHGHLCGDQVLMEIALRLQREARNTDCLARLGGEEFVFLMPNTDLSGAMQIAERIRLGIADTPFELDASTAIEVTISIGVAICTAQDAVFEAVLNRADQALYTAKGSGRNRVVSNPASV